MNLLKKYIPHFSGHVECIQYNEEQNIIDIVFFDKPENFKPMLKLTFSGVSEKIEEKFEDPESNMIELIIGLDLINNMYCLHTDNREITFKATDVIEKIIKT